jgi:hypothetical protein
MRDQAHPIRVVGPTFAILLALNLSGCGASDELPRQAVSGTVTFAGKRLDAGLITFLPETAEMATQGGGPIVAGKYAIARDQGLVPGKYKVTISSSGGGKETIVDTTNNMPGMPPVPSKEVIPERYNTASTLTAEVKAEGANVFDFDLTPGPGSK